MIPITQNIKFAPCDGFSQITSQIDSMATFLFKKDFKDDRENK